MSGVDVAAAAGAEAEGRLKLGEAAGAAGVAAGAHAASVPNTMRDRVRIAFFDLRKIEVFVSLYSVVPMRIIDTRSWGMHYDAGLPIHLAAFVDDSLIHLNRHAGDPVPIILLAHGLIRTRCALGGQHGVVECF